MLLPYCLKGVKPYRMSSVARIKINHVVYSLFGYKTQYLLGELAVRVYQTHSLTLSYIVYEHIFHQGALPGASLTYDVDMLSAIFPFYAKRVTVAEISLTDN